MTFGEGTMEDDRKRIEEKKRCLHSLIDEIKGEKDIDLALEKMIQLDKTILLHRLASLED